MSGETKKIPREYFIEELGVVDSADRWDEALPPPGYGRSIVPVHRERPRALSPSRAIHHSRVRPKKEVSPLLYVGVTFFLIVFFTWITLNGIAAWNDFQDTLAYGKPNQRTSQVDVVVGHGDNTAHPSHFIAMNHNHQVSITECSAGNNAHCINYIPAAEIVGPGSEKIVVTLTFQDVNGDGKLDMLVHIHFPDEKILFYINTGKAFRPANSTDKINAGEN